MADLTKLNDNTITSLVGVNATGVPTNAVGADTNLNLLVKDYSDGPVTPGTAAQVSTLVGGQYNSTLPTLTTTQQAAVQLDSNGRLITVNSDRTGSGSLTTTNSVVVANTLGCSTVSFNVTGTWAGSIFIQASNNGGSTYEAIIGYDISNGSSITAFSVNSFISVPCGGFSNVQLIINPYTSGTANVTWDASLGSNALQVFSTFPAAFMTTARLQDGSGNAIASASIASTQRLSVYLPSEGADNTTAPSWSVQIGGVDPTGKLQTFITDTSGAQYTKDIINVSATNGTITVGTTAIQAKVGSTALVNRKLLEVYCNGVNLFYGYSSSVTTTTGFPITKQTLKQFAFSDNVPVWLIAASAGNTVLIGESS